MVFLSDDFDHVLASRAKEIKQQLHALNFANYQAVDDLKTGGKLSRQLPGYKERPSQLQMVRNVSLALATSKHAIIEAPTGTGKSLAYLIPIIRTGTMAIVSTSNKALQNQLYGKDVPFLQRYLQDFKAVLIKGKSNYLCLDRLEAFAKIAQDDMTYKQLSQVIKQDYEDFDGDIANLSFQMSPETQEQITVDSDQCAWKKCAHYEHCYLRKLKVSAENANVIITNHKLLLLDALSDGRILPTRKTLVIDEAHTLEQVATDVFTKRIKPTQITTLLSLSLLKKYASNKIQDEIREQSQLLWALLDARFGETDKTQIELDKPVQEGLKLASMLSKLASELEAKHPQNLTDKDETLYKKLITRVEGLSDTVKSVFALTKREEYVYFAESVLIARHKQSVTQIEVAMVPLDVSQFVRESLYKDKTVIATSATISTQGTFSYFKSRLGIDDAIEQILSPVFNYQRNSLLYLPSKDRIPEPTYNHPQKTAYEQAVAREMLRLIDISKGRAFLLFSSRRMLATIYEQIGIILESRYQVFCQGNGLSNAAIIDQFKLASRPVLFGLKSFWEGVDIAGEKLSLVVIDKLPFVTIDDPVQRARTEKINAQATSYLECAFPSYVIPQIVIQLKQGLGRLIRKETDTGVMAILDTRLSTKSYGRSVKSSLPPARQTNRIEDVATFFHNETSIVEEF